MISVVTWAQDVKEKELRAAIDTMAILIEKNYVFPSKGKMIASKLLQSYKQGNYKKIRTWKELDSLLSKDLRSFSNDGHMYVGYDRGIVKDLLNPTQAQNEEDQTTRMKRALESNFGFKEVKILEGNIGYIKLTQIDISTESLPLLYAAMQFVKNTRALVIDLGNNGGGGSEIGPVFESFFLPKDKDLLEFHTRDGQSRTEKTVGWLTEKKYEKPLYIIVNKGTASAAEAFTFGLQHHKRAVVVGEGSAGGAHMNSWYPVNEHTYLSVSTAAPVIPGTEQSWEGKGITPDVRVNKGEEINAIVKMLSKNDGK